MPTSQARSIDQPHETRPFKAHGHMDVITLDDFTMGHGVFEPGWRWSEDVKPIAGTDSCRARHAGYCLSGQMTVKFDDGSEMNVGPGDVVLHVSRPRRVDGRRRAVRPARHGGGGVRKALLTAP